MATRRKASKKATPTAVAKAPKAEIIKAEDLPEVQGGFLTHNFPTDHLMSQIEELFSSPDVNQFTLLRIKVPAGGGVAFGVDTLDGVKSRDSLRCVILGNTTGRAWWKVSFDESGGGSPPECSSEDARVGFGTLPAEVLKERGWTPEQGIPGQGDGYDCQDCPFSQWGSDRKGRNGQDCKQFRALFVLLEEEIVPAVVIVPPSSLRSVQNYFMKVTRAAVGGAHRFVTEISLKQKPGPPPYSEIQLEAAGSIEDSLIPPTSEFAKTVEAMRQVVRNKFIPEFTIDVSDVESAQ